MKQSNHKPKTSWLNDVKNRLFAPIAKFAEIIKPEMSQKDIFFGADNKLPQELLRAVLSSGTARLCWNKKTQFVIADGFTDEIAAAHMANRKQTADALAAELATQAALFEAVAMFVQYNMQGEPAEAYFVEISKLRKRTDEGWFRYNPRLGERGYKESEDIIMADARLITTPQQAQNEVQRQLNDYGKQYGSILYIYRRSEGQLYYRIPTAYANIEDIQSDAMRQYADSVNIAQGMADNYIFTTIGDLDNTTKDENGYTENDIMKKRLSEIRGIEGTGRILGLKASTIEGVPKLDTMSNEKKFAAVADFDNRVSRNVCTTMGVPPVLIGKQTAGQLGNQQEVANLVKMFNSDVLGLQSLITEAFTFVWPDIDWTLSTLNMFSYIPTELLDVLTDNEKRAMIGYDQDDDIENVRENLNAGQITSLLAIAEKVQGGLVTPAAAVEIIRLSFGISIERAYKMLGLEVPLPPTTNT